MPSRRIRHTSSLLFPTTSVAAELSSWSESDAALVVALGCTTSPELASATACEGVVGGACTVTKGIAHTVGVVSTAPCIGGERKSRKVSV